jgi:RNA polymerase sigma factor (TIGR02999 family)
MSDVTRLLDAAAAGDRRPAPTVYDELRKLAAARLAEEKPRQTLQPTALVHEAYVRLVGPDPGQPWDGRGHFFAAAPEAMRHILIDASRRKQGRKHGGDGHRENLHPDAVAAPEADLDLVAIAKVFDAGESASGRPYFITEVVKGVPVTDICDRNRPTPRQRLEVFISTCSAVQHVHQKGSFTVTSSPVTCWSRGTTRRRWSR